MPAKPKRPAAAKRPHTPEAEGAQTDPAVIAFLRELEHPHQQEIEALRELVLAASPQIREGLKWNAPSFRTTDFFATIHLRAKKGVALILHTGAKVKESARSGLQLADPEGLLTWLAKDRAMVTLEDGQALVAKREALQALLRAWVAALPD